LRPHPPDPGVPRVREEAAAAQRGLEARDLGEPRGQQRREPLDERLRMLAEERECEVLRLGPHPRRRRQLRTHGHNAVVEQTKNVHRERRRDEKPHWTATGYQSPWPARNSGVKIRAISSSLRILRSRSSTGIGFPVFADSFAISAARA